MSNDTSKPVETPAWPHVSPLVQRIVAAGSHVAPHLAATSTAFLYSHTSRPAGDEPAAPEGTPPYDLRAFDLDIGPTIGYAWGDVETAPLVHLVHGWDRWGLELAHLVAPLLAKGFAVLAIDQFAHGRSAGTHNSLTGFIQSTRELVRRYPTTAGLIGAGFGGTALIGVLTKEKLNVPAVLIDAPSRKRQYIERFAHEAALPEKLVDEMQATIEHDEAPEFSGEAYLKLTESVTTPVLIIQDDSDEIVPLENGQRFAALIPGAILHQTSGLGHRGALSDPATIELVTDFIAQHQAGA